MRWSDMAGCSLHSQILCFRVPGGSPGTSFLPGVVPAGIWGPAETQRSGQLGPPQKLCFCGERSRSEMDELSPKAEARNMELVATRGEDEQGSKAQFSPSLGGNEAKRTLRGRGFGPRAEFLSAPPERNQRAGDSAACGRRDAPPIMRPRFRLRATYFSHGRKVGKSPHRGSASDSTWSQGRSMLIVGHPPKNPRFTGE